MIVNMYGIYDSAAKAYTKPLFMQTDGLAMRMFTDIVQPGQDSDISKHPEQFKLFKLGEYDDQTGIVTCDEGPQIMANGHELVNYYEGSNEVAEVVDLETAEVVKIGGNK
jgi:hypothetical protein